RGPGHPERDQSGEHQPAVPIHGRAFPTSRRVHPEVDLADRRVIGEERPIQSLEHRVDDRECDPEGDRESREPVRGRPGHRCCGGYRRGPIEFGDPGVCIQGLRHDPTPRKLLATWPDKKEYQTATAMKTVTHLRMAACSSDNGCRQKYQ